jgi:hypothetical protein
MGSYRVGAAQGWKSPTLTQSRFRFEHPSAFIRFHSAAAVLHLRFAERFAMLTA